MSTAAEDQTVGMLDMESMDMDAMDMDAMGAEMQLYSSACLVHGATVAPDDEGTR